MPDLFGTRTEGRRMTGRRYKWLTADGRDGLMAFSFSRPMPKFFLKFSRRYRRGSALPEAAFDLKYRMHSRDLRAKRLAARPDEGKAP